MFPLKGKGIFWLIQLDFGFVGCKGRGIILGVIVSSLIGQVRCAHLKGKCDNIEVPGKESSNPP